VQETGKLRSKAFKPTTASPENWDDKLIDKLVSDVEVVRDQDVRSVTKDGAPDDILKKNAESVEEKAQMRAAAETAAELSAEMEKELQRLYAVDPAGKEVSLRWTDEFVKAPFTTFDTVEKVRSPTQKTYQEWSRLQGTWVCVMDVLNIVEGQWCLLSVTSLLSGGDLLVFHNRRYDDIFTHIVTSRRHAVGLPQYLLKFIDQPDAQPVPSIR
jgi:hypothetical protein